MSYNKHFDRDEIDQIECEGCGITCLATDLEEGMCPMCLDMVADQENLNFARDEFRKSIMDALQNSLASFTLTMLENKLAEIGTEDELWSFTNELNAYVNRKEE